MEKSYLKTEIKNLKMVNDEKVKKIEKLKSENRRVREEVNEHKKSLVKLLRGMSHTSI